MYASSFSSMELILHPAYKEGREACIKYDSNTKHAFNPYCSGTKPFYAWNMGWNSVF